MQVEQRPWGEFETLLDDKYCKVKRITIKAGHRFSLQLHHKRAEDWTCVSGLLRVTIGTSLEELRTEFVPAGCSIHIPAWTLHRAEAFEGTDAIFIEVQTGSYFGEDDITRYSDDYGR